MPYCSLCDNREVPIGHAHTASREDGERASMVEILRHATRVVVVVEGPRKIAVDPRLLIRMLTGDAVDP